LKLQILTVSNCATMPNCQAVAAISQFLAFQDGGYRHLGF